jgi:hypothetical protein
MRDITSPKLLYVKGALFLLCGTFAGGILLAERPTTKIAVLLALAIWSFARVLLRVLRGRTLRGPELPLRGVVVVRVVRAAP